MLNPYSLPGFEKNRGVLYNGTVLIGYVLVMVVVTTVVFVVVFGAV
jgi:hypothetical protein